MDKCGKCGYFQIVNIKNTPEYKKFLKYFTDTGHILNKYAWKNTLSGNLYLMLNKSKFIRRDKKYYICLFSNCIYRSSYAHAKCKEINVCLKLIYLFYKDVYIVFNTIILQELHYTFNYIYLTYRAHYIIIKYLYKKNKHYTFSKFYAYFENNDELTLPIICFSNNNINNFFDIFDLIKLKIETTSDSELMIHKYKTEINALYDLIKYNQTGGMSINRICWIRLVVFISNR